MLKMLRDRISLIPKCALALGVGGILFCSMALLLFVRSDSVYELRVQSGNLKFAQQLSDIWHEFHFSTLRILNDPNDLNINEWEYNYSQFDQLIVALLTDEERLSFISGRDNQLNLDSVTQILDQIAEIADNNAGEDLIQHTPLILQHLSGLHAEMHRMQTLLDRRVTENMTQYQWAWQSITYAIYIAMAGALIMMSFALMNIIRSQKGQAEPDVTATSLLSSLDRRKVEAFDTSPDAIMLTNVDGLIEYINPSMTMMFGQDTVFQELSDRLYHEPWYSVLPKDQQWDLREEILPVIKKGQGWAKEVIFDIPGAGQKHILVSLRDLSDKALLCVFKDITGKVISENENAELRKQFFQAQKMESIGRMAGGIAHDFNNILSAIMGYAEFLEEDLEQGSMEHSFAEKITAASKQAKSLINRILSFSRHGTGEKVPVDVSHLMQVTHDMIRSSSSDNVQIEINKNIKDAITLGNPTEISQVLMNLCVNARDAMEGDEGRVILTLSDASFDERDMSCWAADDDGDGPKAKTRIINIDNRNTCVYAGVYDPEKEYFCVEIKDTGTGILPAIIEQIFEPFFTTKDQDKGTGLGLSSSLGIVLGHKGLLKVQSIVGEGTSFRLYLPVEKMEPKAEDVKSLSQDDLPSFAGASFSHDAAKHQEAAAKEDEARKKVLLVDDDDDVRETVGMMLYRLGFDVTEYADPKAALEYAQAHIGEYDLLVTDYKMPEMNGGELAEEINDMAPYLPIIVISGLAEEDFENNVSDLDYIMAFIKKPINKQDLRDLLDQLFEGYIKNS